ncbi:transcription factor [Pseudohyphozyma bogoriensis]|nr:transcription factor [Pseudohyphozyma bogoriensis]
MDRPLDHHMSDELDLESDDSAASPKPGSSSAAGASKGKSRARKHKAPAIDPETGLPKKKRKQRVRLLQVEEVRDPLTQVKCNKSETGESEACAECAKKGIKQLYGDGGGPGGAGSGEGNSPGPSQPTQPPPTKYRSSPVSTEPSKSQSVVRASDTRLVNGELARSMADHLIQTFGQYMKLQCPVLEWDRFMKEWDASGRNPEAMSPVGECVALTCQAWGSRFSDHPSIVGSGAPQLVDLPKLRPGTDLTGYGQARDAFAKSMTERALQTIDAKGALRRASGQCSAVLILMEFLMTFNDVYRGTGRHMMLSAVEHLRSRNDGMGEDPEDVISAQDRISGGTLFWTVLTRDAISATFGSRSTFMTDEDAAVMCGLIDNPICLDVMPFITSHDASTLSGLAVVAVFRHITMLIRSFAQRVCSAAARRQRLDPATVQEMWDLVDQSSRYSDIFRASVNAAVWSNSHADTDRWFRDLITMRSQLLHAIQLSIVQRIEVELRQPGPADTTAPHYLETLHQLKHEADARFLASCREVAKLVHHHHAILVSTAALASENIVLYLQHMIQMPPGSPPSWTIAAKQAEISWMVEAIKMLGWCWPGYRQAASVGEAALASLSAATVAARPPIPRPPSVPYLASHQPMLSPVSAWNGGAPSQFTDPREAAQWSQATGQVPPGFQMYEQQPPPGVFGHPGGAATTPGALPPFMDYFPPPPQAQPPYYDAQHQPYPSYE